MKVFEDNIPAPIIVVEDLFSESELGEIMEEIDGYRAADSLRGPAETATATDGDGNPLKSNLGLFMDEMYEGRRGSSPVLTRGRKLFDSPEIQAAVINHSSWYFRDLFSSTNFDTTLLTYYDHGGYYKPHRDYGEYTILVWLFREPRRFDGGVFSFPEYGHEIELAHNKAIYFPSRCLHAVSEITMPERYRGKGFGRYTLTTFVSSRYAQPKGA